MLIDVPIMGEKGKKIQLALVDKRKKQKDLAKYLDLSESELSRKLRKDTISIEDMSKISQFLGVDFNFLNVNSNVKSSISGDEKAVQEVEHLKQLLAMKDELLRSKDEIIQTLRDQLRK